AKINLVEGVQVLVLLGTLILSLLRTGNSHHRIFLPEHLVDSESILGPFHDSNCLTTRRKLIQAKETALIRQFLAVPPEILLLQKSPKDTTVRMGVGEDFWFISIFGNPHLAIK